MEKDRQARPAQWITWCGKGPLQRIASWRATWQFLNSPSSVVKYKCHDSKRFVKQSKVRLRGRKLPHAIWNISEHRIEDANEAAFLSSSYYSTLSRIKNWSRKVYISIMLMDCFLYPCGRSCVLNRTISIQPVSDIQKVRQTSWNNSCESRGVELSRKHFSNAYSASLPGVNGGPRRIIFSTQQLLRCYLPAIFTVVDKSELAH